MIVPIDEAKYIDVVEKEIVAKRLDKGSIFVLRKIGEGGSYQFISLNSRRNNMVNLYSSNAEAIKACRLSDVLELYVCDSIFEAEELLSQSGQTDAFGV